MSLGNKVGVLDGVRDGGIWVRVKVGDGKVGAAGVESQSPQQETYTMGIYPSAPLVRHLFRSVCLIPFWAGRGAPAEGRGMRMRVDAALASACLLDKAVSKTP